jgi:hypothetical protein
MNPDAQHTAKLYWNYKERYEDDKWKHGISNEEQYMTSEKHGR